MNAAHLGIRLSIVFALSGMFGGLYMAISHDHSLMPAHAHLLLLGWVSLCLFSLVYTQYPRLATRRAAGLQVVGWSFGVVIMIIGVAGITQGHEGFVPVAAAGSLLCLAMMGLFGVLIWRSGRDFEAVRFRSGKVSAMRG